MNRSVHLLDLDTKRIVANLGTCFKKAWFSPTGDSIIIPEKKRIRIYSRTGAILHQYDLHGHFYGQFSSQADMLMTHDDRYQLHFYESLTGRPFVVSFDQHAKFLGASPSFKQVVLQQGPRGVRIVDVRTGQETATLELEHNIVNGFVSEDGQMIALSLRDEEARRPAAGAIISLATGKVVCYLQKTLAHPVAYMDYMLSPGNQYCLAHLSYEAKRQHPHLKDGIVVWQAETGKLLHEWPDYEAPTLMPDGRFLAAHRTKERDDLCMLSYDGHELDRLKNEAPDGCHLNQDFTHLLFWGKGMSTGSRFGVVELKPRHFGPLHSMIPADELFIKQRDAICFGHADSNVYVMYRNHFVAFDAPGLSPGMATDVSDAPFIIKTPRLQLQRADLGAVQVGESVDKKFTAFAKNPNPVPVRIDSVLFEGASDFEVVAPQLPYTIPPNGALDFEFRFAPGQSGSRQAALRMVTSGGVEQSGVGGKGLMRTYTWATKGHDFGVARIGAAAVKASPDKLLTNTGSTALFLKSIRLAHPDFTLEGPTSVTLQPGQSLKRSIGFRPRSVGHKQARLLITMADGSEAQILLTGLGEAPPLTVDVQAETLGPDGAPLPCKQITVEEIRTRTLHPLLNYVFFAHLSTEWPERYPRLTSEQTSTFDEKAIEAPDALPIYYHLLNIVGKRMHDRPKARLTLIGRISQEEKSNPKLSEQRAAVVRAYLTEVWRIAPERILMKAGGLPEKATGGNDEDAHAENRRVEILCDDPEVTAPVRTEALTFDVQPKPLRFRCVVTPDSCIREWRLMVSQSGEMLMNAAGAGVQPAVEWKAPARPLNKAMFAYQLYAADCFQQYDQSALKTVPVKYVDLKSKTGSHDKVVDRFNLILFDFNKADLSDDNARILRLVTDKIKAGSSVRITGHTDRIGDATQNKAIAKQRATTVGTALIRADAAIEGKGEDELLYDNTLPEGRFYCRTVVVFVENVE